MFNGFANAEAILSCIVLCDSAHFFCHSVHCSSAVSRYVCVVLLRGGTVGRCCAYAGKKEKESCKGWAVLGALL